MILSWPNNPTNQLYIRFYQIAETDIEIKLNQLIWPNNPNTKWWYQTNQLDIGFYQIAETDIEINLNQVTWLINPNTKRWYQNNLTGFTAWSHHPAQFWVFKTMYIWRAF